MPSQKQLKWSQLKVGLTVVVSAILLAVLIILMSGGGGPFTSKVALKSYFPDAGGLRQGAPVRLAGVEIGNVKEIAIVQNPPDPADPVEVTMKVRTKYKFFLRKDSVTILSTAGVLGETYVNIDSAHATKPPVQDGDVLQSKEQAGYDDVVRAANSSLQNMDVLLKRMDRIIAFVESGQGSIGKAIYDPALYNKLNATVGELQNLVSQISQGQGSLGKLIATDELYDKANATVDKVNQMIDQINAGKGTVGKFINDPTLYNNANQAVANIKQMTDDINAGKGALGKIAKDQEFANKLQNTMNRLSDMMDQINAGQGTMGKLMKDPALYNNTNQLLTDSQDLIKAIRQNPKKYLTIHLKLF